MNINVKIKNILWVVFAVALVVVAALWMLADPKFEHIEDTNGADNYSLQTITEQDVVEQKMGMKGSVSKSEVRLGNLSNGIANTRPKSLRAFTDFTPQQFSKAQTSMLVSQDLRSRKGISLFTLYLTVRSSVKSSRTILQQRNSP